MSYSFDGAVIKEQGVTFAIAVVKRGTLANTSTRDKTLVEFQKAFDGLPTVLMEQNSSGTPTYYGRKDIVNFLSKLHISQIPWRKYTVS